MYGTNYGVPLYGAFCTPHSHPSCSPQDLVFTNPYSLRSSLNVRDHVSQPYSASDNIIVLYILIFKFLGRSLEDIGTL